MAFDKAFNAGFRRVAVTSSVDVVLDLTSLIRKRVKLWADQDFYFMVASSASAAMDVTAANKAVGTANIPEQVLKGYQGVAFTVNPAEPYLYLRAVGGDAQIQGKQISDNQADA